jgi:C1A family cysteine protease
VQSDVVGFTHQATEHELLVVHNIRNTESDMKASLAAGNPFAVAISVFASFETDEVSRSGVVPMPRHNEACLGGHVVVCVGYDDHRRVWIMRNSWGACWGDRGYFTLPYAYLLDASLASDLWNIAQAK